MASSTSTINRLQLTGAAGGLGQVLRQSLKPYTQILRLSDIQPLGDAQAGEECVPCDLADKVAMQALLAGVDAVVHMGGVSTEAAFEPVMQANILGLFHLYEGARVHGVRRIVFASSNHANGFHKQGEVIDSDCVKRPDSYYGLSKSYGEDLSRFYFDRYGIETVCLRIGSCFPEPIDRRMLVTWLSYRDLTELVRCALFAPKVDHTMVFGVSNNRDKWWDNSKAAHLGFVAQDNTEPYRAKLEATPARDAADPAKIYQGGAFVKFGPF